MAGIAGSKSQKQTPDGKMTPLAGKGVFEMQVSSTAHGIGHNLGLIHDDEGVMKDQTATVTESPGLLDPNKKTYTRTFNRNNVTKGNAQNLTNRVDGMTEKGREYWKNDAATQKEPATKDSGVTQFQQ